MEYLCLYITFPNMQQAKRITAILLEQRLVACANIIPAIESHYWWDGKIQTSAEVLGIFKTQASRYQQVEECIAKQHPYDVPCIVAFPITHGATSFLQWIQAETEPLT